MLALAFAALVSASSLELPTEYYVISDFIASHKECVSGSEAYCARHIELCSTVVPYDARLKGYIQNGHPIRSKNGGMNIKARYDRAIRDCSVNTL